MMSTAEMDRDDDADKADIWDEFTVTKRAEQNKMCVTCIPSFFKQQLGAINFLVKILIIVLDDQTFFFLVPIWIGPHGPVQKIEICMQQAYRFDVVHVPRRTD